MSRREVNAEIAGTVFSIGCSAGQSVAADDILVVIESMKMEVPVTAGAAGRVASLAVSPGDVVHEGQTLLVLES